MGAYGQAAAAPIQAMSTFMAIDAETKTGMDNAYELERSANLERANAAVIEQQGALQAGLLRQRGSQFEAAARVQQAVGNVDTTSGTPADIQQQSRIYADLDAATATNNARRAASGQREVARRYSRESTRVKDMYYSDAGFMGLGSRNGMQTLNATTSLMSSAASFGMGGGQGGGF